LNKIGRLNVFAFILATLLLLSACGSNTGGNGGNAAADASPGSASPAQGGSSGEASAGDKVKISFIHWRGEDAEAFDSIIQKFEQEHPNIQVETQVFPSEQYQTVAQAKLSDGSVGDVFA